MPIISPPVGSVLSIHCLALRADGHRPGFSGSDSPEGSQFSPLATLSGAAFHAGLVGLRPPGGRLALAGATSVLGVLRPRGSSLANSRPRNGKRSATSVPTSWYVTGPGAAAILSSEGSWLVCFSAGGAHSAGSEGGACAAELVGRFAKSRTHQQQDRQYGLEPQPVREWPPWPGQPGKQCSLVLTAVWSLHPSQSWDQKPGAPRCTLAVARGPGIVSRGDVDVQITRLRLMCDPQCLYGLHRLLSSLKALVLLLPPVPVAPLRARREGAH